MYLKYRPQFYCYMAASGALWIDPWNQWRVVHTQLVSPCSSRSFLENFFRPEIAHYQLLVPFGGDYFPIEEGVCSISSF